MFDPKVLANQEATDDELREALHNFVEIGGNGQQFVALLIGLRIGHEQTDRLLDLLREILGDQWEQNESSE